MSRSPVLASHEQKEALSDLAASHDRAEADRARAILLTLEGWISARIGAAFGVREDVERGWRSTFARAGVEGLFSRVASGRPPIKALAALTVADELLSGLVRS